MHFSWPYILTIGVAIALVMHVVRTGRNSTWIFILLFLPGLGSLAYVVVEILPGLFSGHHAKALNRGMSRALNPNKELNDARRALDIAPTVANRIRLGRLLLDRESWDEAIETLKPALTDFFAGDPALLEGLATAFYAKGDYAQALTYIDQLIDNKDWPVKPHIELLRARIYEMQSQPGPAEDIYARLAKSSSGEEAKVAYAQFLVKQNRTAEAKPILADIVKRSGYMSAHARKMEDEWIGVAKRELGKIS